MIVWTVCLAWIGRAGADDQTARPNILFIGIDDLNDWVGCLDGHPQALTPNIDRLAGQGVLFTNAQCAAPICNPSRNALMTGRQPYNTDLYTNGENLHRRRPDLMTLPRYLREQGYQAFGAGKLFHSVSNHGPEDWDAYGPNAHSGGQKGGPFTKEEMQADLQNPTHFVERLGATLPLNSMPNDRPGRGVHSFDWGPVNVADEEMSDGMVARWAIDRLVENRPSPFFLGVGFYRPHIPLYAPRKYFDKFPVDSIELPSVIKNDLADVPRSGREISLPAMSAGLHSTVVENDQWRPAVAAYLACVNFVDAQVGKVLEALDSSKHADNTVIVLWGDHGWHLGEKEHWGKFTGWERSARVPLIIVPPRSWGSDAFKPGARCDRPVSLIDLFPTLLSMAGVEKPNGLDGHDLTELINDPEADWPYPAVTTFGRGNHSIRTDRWRLIQYFDGTRELYDMKADPNEWTNLAGRAEVARVETELLSHVPMNPRIAHTARLGGWKAAIYKDGRSLLFDHTRPPGYADDEDVASKNAKVVKRVVDFIRSNPETPARFSIP